MFTIIRREVLQSALIEAQHLYNTLPEPMSGHALAASIALGALLGEVDAYLYRVERSDVEG